MASDFIIFQAMDVGQGTGNFVEIYADKKLANTVLLDLGSLKKKAEAGGPSAEYIVGMLKTMDQPTLDLVLISHSDSDHLNLISQVYGAFKPVGTPGVPKNKTLIVKHVAYGGFAAKYKKSSSNVLLQLQAYGASKTQPVKIWSLSAQVSSFDKAHKSKPFWTINDLEIYLLVGNTALESGGVFGKEKGPTDSFSTNTNSLVSLLRYHGISMVMTGDATGVTMQAINKLMAKDGDIKKIYLKDVLLMTTPHHGSRRTSLDMFQFKGENDDYGVKNLQRFAANMAASVITASADRSTHRHPASVILKYFWPHLVDTLYYIDPYLEKTARHFYSAYFRTEDGFTVSEDGIAADWPAKNNWYTVETQFNNFVNLYADADAQAGVVLPPTKGKKITPYLKSEPQPPFGVAWSFIVLKDGTTGVDRLDNRKAELLLRQAVYQGEIPEGIVPLGPDEQPVVQFERLIPPELRLPKMPLSPEQNVPQPPEARNGHVALARIHPPASVPSKPGLSQKPAPGFRRMNVIR